MVGWHHRLDGHEFEQALEDGEGQKSLVCCNPWGHRESDQTERVNNKYKTWSFVTGYCQLWGFPRGSEVKAPACNPGDLGSIPELGRYPEEGNSNPLQYSCLENPMDGGAWWATVHRVAKNQTWLSDFTFTVSIMLSRFIHIVASIGSSFFFFLSYDIPQYEHTTCYVSIHHLMDI